MCVTVGSVFSNVVNGLKSGVQRLVQNSMPTDGWTDITDL
jgi:hypothetical protein